MLNYMFQHIEMATILINIPHRKCIDFEEIWSASVSNLMQCRQRQNKYLKV